MQTAGAKRKAAIESKGDGNSLEKKSRQTGTYRKKTNEPGDNLTKGSADL